MDFFSRHESGANRNDAALHSVVGIDAISPSLQYQSPQRSTAYNQSDAASSSASIAAVQLPPIETASFSSGRHEVNPAMALNLLQDLQAAVIEWQTQLRHVVAAMRAIYAQGPMVDGWLQSSLLVPPSASSAHLSQVNDHPAAVRALSNDVSDATILRHGDADALMKYVESLGQCTDAKDGITESNGAVDSGAECRGHAQRADRTQSVTHSIAGQAQYWLCCLSDDGAVQSQPCPPEQMATVGKAIARFQKFKQLKLQQQALEAKLQQVVDMLTGVRNGIRESLD